MPTQIEAHRFRIWSAPELAECSCSARSVIPGVGSNSQQKIVRKSFAAPCRQTLKSLFWNQMKVVT